jgi:SAM-dependent methyltransferase
MRKVIGFIKSLYIIVIDLVVGLWSSKDTRFFRESGKTNSMERERYDLIPKGQYDYVPKGKYVSGPADKFLLVPKNRYRVVLLPEMPRHSNHGIGWLTEDNSPDGYDLLWGDPEALDLFREEADNVRDRLTREIVDNVIRFIKPNDKVVDIGCGVGDLLTEIYDRMLSVNVYGCDFSEKAIEGASRRLPHGLFQRHAIHKNLPYRDESFDVVLCSDVLEHLEYPSLIVAELVRICRTGGLVAIIVPDGDEDQFFGHCWFWNEISLIEMLVPYTPIVKRLPETREFLAVIFKQ